MIYKVTQVTSGPDYFTAKGMAIALEGMINNPQRKLFPTLADHDNARKPHGHIGNRYKVTIIVEPIDENGDLIDE